MNRQCRHCAPPLNVASLLLSLGSVANHTIGNFAPLSSRRCTTAPRASSKHSLRSRAAFPEATSTRLVFVLRTSPSNPTRCCARCSPRRRTWRASARERPNEKNAKSSIHFTVYTSFCKRTRKRAAAVARIRWRRRRPSPLLSRRSSGETTSTSIGVASSGAGLD